jgi:D-alanine-D-alanine ligase
MTGAISMPQLQTSDPAAFGRVAVLYGGDSSEREVSLNSFATVIEALKRRGIDAVGVDGVDELLAGVSSGRFDRVFNIMHGGAGENGVVQGLLEAAGIPYTGSGVLGSALTMDKIRTKQVWLSLDLPTPAYECLQPGADVLSAAERLGFPLIVKPALEGSSVGVSRVFRREDLTPAIELAERYGRELLMERLIEGEEYTVGILAGVALPSIRIVPPGEYYDYHAKYVSDDTQYICPGMSPEQDATIRALALEAFNAAGAYGWGRVDLMRDRQGKDWLLEVNTTPGMTSHSLVPKAAIAAGIPIDDLVWRILETSMGGSCAGARV